MELEAEPKKADAAAHSETLRDTAPVLEGIKVTSLKTQSVSLVLVLQEIINLQEHRFLNEASNLLISF